jgi:EAL domain-containing protein (putative c-di-GMP-specific phosphodiesterase class I)
MRSDAMENQWLEQSPICAAFGHRKVRRYVCVVDHRQHIRTFLCDILDELGFITCECAEFGEFNKHLYPQHPQRPDLIVLGLSGNGKKDAEMLKTLAAEKFGGMVLLLGSNSPLVPLAQEFGEKLGLTMLPPLHTPFGSVSLCSSVAILLPIEVPPPSPVDIAEAVSAGWLELWYQPKIDVHTNAVEGAEALIRIRHPTWGIVTPAYFIPADDDPRFAAISEFVIDQAVQDWRDFVIRRGPIEIAINLPIAFLQKPGAIPELWRRMPNHPAFDGMVIEINGVEATRSLSLAKAIARQLRFYNIGISINDLGEEWPSLMGLDDFPLIELKVDRKLVTGCAHAPVKKKVCRRIIDLAHGYGIRTVADGVETRDDFYAVREMGFDLVHRTMFGKPMAAKKFATALS